MGSNVKSIRYHDFHFCPRSYGRPDCWCWLFRFKKSFYELTALMERFPIITQKGKNFR